MQKVPVAQRALQTLGRGRLSGAACEHGRSRFVPGMSSSSDPSRARGGRCGRPCARLPLAGAAERRRNGLLEPPGKKVWFGVSDTGNTADFGAFSTRSASTRR